MEKNILRMFSSLIFWTAVYVLFEWFVFGLDLHSCKMYLIARYWHMWFIWMIMGLYMIIPFIRQIIKVPKLIRYYLVIFLFASCSCSNHEIYDYSLYKYSRKGRSIENFWKHRYYEPGILSWLYRIFLTWILF